MTVEDLEKFFGKLINQSDARSVKVSTLNPRIIPKKYLVDFEASRELEDQVLAPTTIVDPSNTGNSD
jgi:hypothetical protein